MTRKLLAAAALVAAATPALASGLDSRRSPYPAAAYPGYVGAVSAYAGPLGVTHDQPSPAYRLSGQHAGGPANLLAR